MASPVSSPEAAPPRDNPARDRIVAAAIDVFGAFGFAKATIQEIAAAAHVSKPLFYRHFRNKQDVFEAVVERVFTDWREALEERVAACSGDTCEALRELFVGMLEYGRARPFLNRLLTRDSQLLLSTQSEVWDRACRALQDLVERLLRAGVERGEVRADVPVEHMADLLTELQFAYANRQILTGAAIAPEIVDALAASMLGGVLCPGASPSVAS